VPQRTRRGLATWLTTSSTPVFVLDHRRVVLVFNSGCEILTGWAAADVIGKVCTFQAHPDSNHVDSVLGALAPPGEIPLRGQICRRTLFLRRDGTRLEREIHYFSLPSSDDEHLQHTLGIVIECPEQAPLEGDLHLDVSRHMADLYARFRIDRLVATTPIMQRVAAQIDLARQHLISVHLQGERGSGREHVARLIHYGSPQKLKRFIPIRCETASHYELSQILERLAEDRDDVGTVYLDEVALLPGDLQPLVLQTIQILSGEEDFRQHEELWLRSEQTGSTGSAHALRPGRRWISSSTKGLEGIPEEGFHPALALQLTALTITLPPLRTRMGDVPLLAQQLLEECNADLERQHTEFAPAVVRLFQQHVWPGNVDELAEVVVAACQRSSTPIIEATDLPPEFGAALQARTIRPLSHTIPLDDQLAQFERSCLVEALKEARGNKSLAAEKLGIPRAKLYRRLEQLGLDVDQMESVVPDITES